MCPIVSTGTFQACLKVPVLILIPVARVFYGTHHGYVRFFTGTIGRRVDNRLIVLVTGLTPCDSRVTPVMRLKSVIFQACNKPAVHDVPYPHFLVLTAAVCVSLSVRLEGVSSGSALLSAQVAW